MTRCSLLGSCMIWPGRSLQVAEMAVQFFITNDRPNVAGLVLAGSADFKTELSQSDMFDPRLQAVVLGVVDVSYGRFLLIDSVGWDAKEPFSH